MLRARLRRLELAWRTGAVRAVATLAGATGAAVPPKWGARPYRVLFVRHDGIGDMILSTGAIRAIASSHPTVTVDVLTTPLQAQALGGNPHVGSVVLFRPRHRLAYPPSLLLAIRRRRYDAVVDAMAGPHVPPSRVELLIASGAPFRVGVAGRANDFIYSLPVTPPVELTTHAERVGALAQPFGVDPRRTDWRPMLVLTDAERAYAWRQWGEVPAGRDGEAGRRMLINVSAGQVDRRWPVERYVRVVRWLQAREPGMRILVVGPPADTERVRAIAGAAQARLLTPTLREAFSLVATAHALFTPNTSIAHAASAFRTPTVSMLLRKTYEYRLYRTPGREVVCEESSLEALAVEPVLRALARVIDEVGRAPSPG